MDYCRRDDCPRDELHEEHITENLHGFTLKRWRAKQSITVDVDAPAEPDPYDIDPPLPPPTAEPIPRHRQHRPLTTRKTRVARVCRYCGDAFEPFVSYVARGYGIYCRRACQNAGMRKQREIDSLGRRR